jgi:hypothetical protein
MYYNFNIIYNKLFFRKVFSVGIICNNGIEYTIINEEMLDKYLVKDTRVIHLVKFEDCNFDFIDINKYAFLDCEFKNCLFNGYPHNTRDSNYEKCLTKKDRNEVWKTIFEMANMMNKEPEDKEGSSKV